MSLPTPNQLKAMLPLSGQVKRFVESSRKMAIDILQGRTLRFLVVCGPCSIHHPKSALDYAAHLAKLAEKIPKCCVIMRTFLEKPRTSIGWKGLIYDPDLDGSHRIDKGLYIARKLLIDLAKLKVMVASEFLDPMLAPYYQDLVTWGFIGARTSESQIHRQLASALPFPVGFKNTTGGAVCPAILGAWTARSAHTFPYFDNNGELQTLTTKGNPHTHIVLRGSNKNPNYSSHSIQQILAEQSMLNAPLLVDCSHGNAQKDYTRQALVAHAIIEEKMKTKAPIFGIMLESFLERGSQRFSTNPSPSQSITDPCLSFEQTANLLTKLNNKLKKHLHPPSLQKAHVYTPQLLHR